MSERKLIQYKGELTLGGMKIPCYVTEDGQRLLAQRRMQVALGVADDDTSYQISGQRMVRFLEQKTLKPLFDKVSNRSLLEPVIVYDNKMKIVSYRAELLPELCNIILQGRRDGALKGSRQLQIAKQCEILLGAFAQVGIVALVDEATGYQDVRARNALEKILEQYLAKELRKWVKTFPDDYYRELFKLRNWPYNENSTKRAPLVGKLTTNIVYDRLAPWIREELEKRNPKLPSGTRRHKHHQHLSEDFGHPRLREHLSSVITLMKISPTWRKFMEYLNRALPKQTTLPLFDEIDRAKDKLSLPSSQTAETEELQPTSTSENETKANVV